jgi:hypothetical protein
MDEKARAASFGLIDQLRLEHPFETEKQIMKRYGERLVADPELMADAMRGFLELARHLDRPRSGPTNSFSEAAESLQTNHASVGKTLCSKNRARSEAGPLLKGRKELGFVRTKKVPASAVFLPGYHSEGDKLNPKVSLKHPPEKPDSPMQGGLKVQRSTPPDDHPM